MSDSSEAIDANDGGLGDWTPVSKVVFSDEDLVRHLRATADRPGERTGNWWAFFSGLPRPEQDRLKAEAGDR